MSSLATVMLAGGSKIFGSDLRVNTETSRLRREGATIHLGHDVRFLDVEVIDENVTVEIVLILDAISNFSDKGFKIYPNPSNGLINLNLGNIPDHIEIFNAFGTQVLDLETNQQEIVIDIQDYPKGIYILNLIYGNEIYSQKLLKNKESKSKTFNCCCPDYITV